MDFVIIVEGKNDRKRLRRVISSEVEILCTYGTPSPKRMEQLKRLIGDKMVFLFTDNDSSGRKIRALLSDLFPDAEQMYTKKGYAGVEGTPEEHLIRQMEKAGLEEYIRYPPPESGLDL